MSKYNEYCVKDLSYLGFNIKELDIFGNSVIEKNEVIKRTIKTIKDFLNVNKDVDFLIAYYYPTPKNMENKVALCSLLLKGDIKHSDLTDIEIFKNIQWNEEYHFFDNSINYRISSDYQLLKEANSMLQTIEEAYFILYKLWTTKNYKEFTESDNHYNCLVDWITKADYIYNECRELRYIVSDDFIDFACVMNNIFQSFLLNIKNKGKNKEIFNREIANARDKYEVIRQKLVHILRVYSIGGNDNNDFLDLLMRYGG